MKTIVKNSLLFLLCTGTLASCSPPKYIPRPHQIQFTTKGSHIILYGRDNRIFQTGELIAVGQDSLFIIERRSNAVNKISKTDISKVTIQVAATSDNPEGISAWGGLLWLTSAAHGWYLVFSLPMNLAVGLPIAGSASMATYNVTYNISYPDISWNEMEKFARFPQGIPESIPLEKIRP